MLSLPSPMPQLVSNALSHASPQFPHVAAVLVLFAAQTDPARTLRNVLGVVGQVVLVDNAHGGHPMAAAWRDEPTWPLSRTPTAVG